MSQPFIFFNSLNVLDFFSDSLFIYIVLFSLQVYM